MDRPIPEAVRALAELVANLAHAGTCCGADDERCECGLFEAQHAATEVLTAAQQPDHIGDATKMVAQQQGQAVACGGCGNADPEKVCIGCLHPFTALPSAPVGVELERFRAPVVSWSQAYDYDRHGRDAAIERRRPVVAELLAIIGNALAQQPARQEPKP